MVILISRDLEVGMLMSSQLSEALVEVDVDIDLEVEIEKILSTERQDCAQTPPEEAVPGL